MRTAAHEGLYEPGIDPPVLLGTTCASCASTFFPPLGIGCEVCGAPAEQLRPAELAARGRLHSVATVHLHQDPDVETPFAIGEIQLDSGPLIRAMLDELLDVEAIGSPMVARWVVVGTTGGDDVVEPRFATSSGEVWR